MIFNEWTFAIFLLVAVAGFALVPRKFRTAWLAVIGACFYAFYGGVWLVVFIVEIIVSRFYGPRSRWSLLGITQAVLLLAIVKYGAFFGNTFGAIANAFGAEVRHFAPIALPLGLSFFVFEFIHYAADRYNGRAVASPQVDYAAFILFFPTMIAGPIKRIQNFSKAIADARVNPADVWFGLTRIAVGLTKKAVLADNLNSLLEYAFVPEAAHLAKPTTLWFYMVVYSFRIYLDFSAYSDIAIGSARLFGLVVPENFNWPYIARNPSEFWRRWHISLSRWITDYLYIPLGGSKAGSRSRTALNTFIAMGLSGLWHGAAGNFVVWGLYHAAALVVYREAAPHWRRFVPESVREHWCAQLGYRATNYVVVVYGWTFFAMPLSIGWVYARRMLGFR